MSEYRHKVRQDCLKKASTKATTIKEARPPAWDLLTTPGRRRSPRSSKHRRWHLAPGIHHLVATTRKKKEGGMGSKATISTHPKYSQASDLY